MTPIEITDYDQLLNLIEDSGSIVVDRGDWRHGNRVTYYIRHLEQDWVTDWIDVHYEDGFQWYGSCYLHPAEQQLVKRWVRLDYTSNLK